MIVSQSCQIPKLKFCSGCSAKLMPKMIDGVDRPACPNCKTIHYQDPKVATACIIVDGNKRVLLVQRSIEPVGLWTIPGGYVDRYEDPDKAAAREVFEETGAKVETTSLQAIYRAPESPVLVLVYLAHILAGSKEPRALHECRDVGFFALQDIPWDRLAFQNTRLALQDYYGLNTTAGL